MSEFYPAACYRLAGILMTRSLMFTRLMLVCLAVWVAAPMAQSDSARVYVTVTDKGGKPLAGITAAEVSVKEDGADKTVLAVEPANDPISVALLVDRFGQDANYGVATVRGALAAAVNTLRVSHADTEISITTIDPAAVPVVPFTTSAAPLTNFIDRIAPGAEQSVLMNGILMAARSMDAAKYPRRAILAMVAGYKSDASSIAGSQFGDALRHSGASLWVLEGRASFSARSPSPNRDAALEMVVPPSGGVLIPVAAGTALESQAKRLATLLTSQYIVTYSVPSVTARRLTVTVSRKNTKVLAPTWIER